MGKRSRKRNKTETQIPIYRDKCELESWEDIPPEEKEKPKDSKVDFYLGFFV